MTKVLIATVKPFAAAAVDKIKEVFDKAGYQTILLEKYAEQADFVDAVKEVDAVIIRSDKATKEVLDGAKNLKVRDIEKTGYYLAKFKNFEYNKGRKDTWELLTNVSWKAWFSFISDLWEDIWEYKINLEWLSSHSIVELIKYVEKLNENEVVKEEVIHDTEIKNKDNKRTLD